MGFWYVSIRQNCVIETNIFVVEKRQTYIKLLKGKLKSELKSIWMNEKKRH